MNDASGLPLASNCRIASTMLATASEAGALLTAAMADDTGA